MQTRRSKAASPRQVRVAAQRYKSFHGELPGEQKRVQVSSRTMPSVLVVLGRCVAVEYEVEDDASSQRKGQVYRHKFGDTGGRMVDSEVYLATDASGRNFYLVNAKPGGRYPQFGARGIVG